MIDFEKARTTMVDCQIRPNDVTDHKILDAFLSVPREKFVNAAQRPFAYIDEDLPLASENPGRYLMETMTLSKLVQLAQIDKDSIVLDIGCASGYSAAVLSQLCSSVVALESDSLLASQASNTLMELGYDNVVVVEGPLAAGWAKEGPYDVIFIGGAVEELPKALGDQLKEGGRLVVVEGTGNAGISKLYVRENGIMGGRRAFNSAVMPLPGFEKEAEFIF